MNYMRDFNINKYEIRTIADVFKFFDVVEKGIKDSRVVIRKLQQSDAAHTAVIASMRRQREATQVPQTKGTATDDFSEIQQVSPGQLSLEFDKEEFLAKMRESLNKESAKDEPKEVTPEDKLKDGIDKSFTVVDDRTVERGSFGIRLMKSGDNMVPRWLYRRRLTKESAIPSDLRPQLKSALDQLIKNGEDIKEVNIKEVSDKEVSDANSSIEQQD